MDAGQAAGATMDAISAMVSQTSTYIFLKLNAVRIRGVQTQCWLYSRKQRRCLTSMLATAVLISGTAQAEEGAFIQREVGHDSWWNVNDGICEIP